MHSCSLCNQSINSSSDIIMIYTSAMKGVGRGQTHQLCCLSFLRSCCSSFWGRTITTESSTKSSSSIVAATDRTPPLPPPCKQQKQQQQVPWLMLSKVDSHEKSRSFFSLDEKQVHKIEFSNTANRSWCSGSSDGWLVMSHKTQGNFLYNPITQQQISLPRHQIISFRSKQEEEKLDERLRKLYEKNRMYFMDKAIVSSVPTITNNSSSLSSSSSSDHDINNIIVAVIYERSCKDGFSGIGFCRPGDKEWCNVPFHKYVGYSYVHGGEENMVPLEGNPDVTSDEEEADYVHEEVTSGEDNNSEEEDEEVAVQGEEGEDNNSEEEDEEVAVEGEEGEDNNSEEEDEEDESSDDDDNDEAYLKFASDIIFYKGAFYVVTGRTTKLGIINIRSSSSGNNKLKGTVRWPDIQPLKLEKSEKHILNNYYLVESCGGELLMVIRIRKEVTSRKALGILETEKFLVFKLDETGDTLKWVRTESLGDQILFLGSNHSKSVSVSDMPGYRGNCIYFTDDERFLFMRGYSGRLCFRDIGVFFLEDEKIEPIFPKDDNPSAYYKKYCSHRKYTPTFITPNPYPSSYTGAVTRDNKN